MELLADTTPWQAANALCRPEYVLSAATALLLLAFAIYRRWTRPFVAGPIAILLLASFAAATLNFNFRSIVTQPDNIAILAMLLAVAFFLWVGLRQAALHDALLRTSLPHHDEPRTYVWPDLVYIELICLLAATIVLIVWSILVKAPLEQPANPAYAPNPAKAPWYFVGLQELLVYFDPWLAGVVYPALAILGLCAIPFIDRTSKPTGCYTLQGRRFAITVFLFGFLILWIVPILIGTFLRGPNWSIFGLFESWDPNKHETLPNIDLSQFWWECLLHRPRPTAENNPLPWLKYWLVREWPGLLLMGTYLFAIPVILRHTLLKHLSHRLGRLRYFLVIFLFLMMLLLVIKMTLHWTLGLKYLIYLPEFNANL